MYMLDIGVNGMTCYFRHIKHLFQEVGIEVTPENKRDIDKAIHQIVGVEYKDCPTTWKAVKARLAKDEEVFLLELKEKLGI